MDTGRQTEAPQASAASELARHWLALLCAVWGTSVGLTGLMFFSFSSFVPLFEQREGWTRGEITIAISLTAFGILLSAPLVGRIIDKFGVRRVLLVAIPLLAIGLLLPTLAGGEPWTLWASYVGLAVLGIGASPIAYARLVTARFYKARGLALGAMLAGTGLSALFVPPFLAAVTESYGIAGGYIGLAALSLTPWLFFVFFIRDVEPVQAKPVVQGESAPPTKGAALSFVLIAACFVIASLGLSGVVVHLVAMMRDAGLSAAQAGVVASGVGIGVICARVVIGFTLDHFYAPAVGIVVFVIAAGGCLLLAYGGTGYAMLAAALIGIAIGGEIDLIAYLVSRYFAPQRFGYIYGWQYGLFTIGAGFSPVALEILRTPDGGYTNALIFAAGAIIVGGLPLLALGQYRH